MGVWRIAVAAVLWIGLVGPASAADKKLIFGVVPQRAAGNLAEQWVPLLDEVGKRMGASIIFRTAPNIPEFEQRMLAGEYDLVYGSALHYLMAERKSGAFPAVRERSDEMGVLVVKQASTINNLADLNGKTLAFPAKSALGASVMLQDRLRQSGVVYDAKYVGSHDSVYRAVASGAAEAGGGVMRTWEAQPAEITQALRILYATRPFPSHPIFFVGDRPGKLVAHFQAVMFSLESDDIGRKVLERADLKGVAPARADDYDAIRSVAGEALQ